VSNESTSYRFVFICARNRCGAANRVRGRLAPENITERSTSLPHQSSSRCLSARRPGTNFLWADRDKVSQILSNRNRRHCRRDAEPPARCGLAMPLVALYLGLRIALPQRQPVGRGDRSLGAPGVGGRTSRHSVGADERGHRSLLVLVRHICLHPLGLNRYSGANGTKRPRARLIARQIALAEIIRSSCNRPGPFP
jgi:hypothetical protein